MLVEIAGRLAAGPRPMRDILVLATTAEEVGLLGAEHFAANPPVPLHSIVAALNFDTVAIHGAGQPLAVIGRGLAPLDAAIAATAAEFGRTMDATYAADAFIQRQDGWALARAGVPAVMVGGAFADMAALQRFLGGDYHGPSDNVRPDIPLDGAAEDANLAVALARRLADPTQYSRP
jgi:Zn-dependent M28 family amino/carboxypeptidase